MKTVLIVDDQEDVRELLEFAFKNAGYVTIGASNVDMGIDLFKKSKIDFIITDYLMPGRNGADFIREIRLISSDIPVFVVTGYSECPRQVLIDLKIQATIFKPFDIDEVVQQVKQILA
jgi:DNA-binding NtrC family response regulator